MARRKFTSKKTAINFYKKVNGEFRDLTKIENATSNYVVVYDGTPKKQKFWQTKLINCEHPDNYWT